MIAKRFMWMALAIMIAVTGYWGGASGAKDPSGKGGIPAEKVADFLHAVIQSDRTFYTVHIVERMQAKGVVVASENWRSANTLPLPAQFLMESAKLAANTQARIGYRLISLWPINKRNGPASESEQRGLWETLQNPDRPYTETVMNGRDLYFQAIYADRAISQACIGCHNAHQDSPRRDLKINDVMGGIAITIPLEP
ncbi:MAG: Tll0287-like domain-containing protein [Nitrospiraceae bacterium]